MFRRSRLQAVLVAVPVLVSTAAGCVVATISAEGEASGADGEETQGRDPDTMGVYEVTTSEGGSTEASTESTTGDGDGDTSGDGDACAASEDCEDEEYCWADYSQGGGQAPAPGDFQCWEECVPTNDPLTMSDPAEQYWCVDSASCCEGGECDDMGYCGEPPGDGDGDGDGDTFDTGFESGFESGFDSGPIP